MGALLVTGGAGFIGSHIVKRFQKENVRVIDNLTTGNLKNLEGMDVEFIRGDVRKKKTVGAAMEGVDTVFHLAANVFPLKSVKNPAFDLATNIGGTLNLLEAARKNEVERFIFSSSASVYGDAERVPIGEDTLPSPKSPYGASKLACEHYMRIYHELYGMKTISLRYFTVYGKRQNHESPYSGVIARFLHNAERGVPLEIHGDGLQRRDFINVKDVAEANARAIKSHAWGVSLNIGTGKSISILDLAKTILKMRNVGVIYREARKGDIRSSVADTRHAGKVLGFKAKISLAQGIKELWGNK